MQCRDSSYSDETCALIIKCLSKVEVSYVRTMGLTSSKHEQESPPVSEIVAIAPKPQHHVRQASIRSRSAQPMPDTAELDRRFTKVLVRET